MIFNSLDACLNNLAENFDVIGIVDCSKRSAADLYLELSELHRDQYKANQRIVLVLSQDQYQPQSNVGITLQNIQTILNDINISNFFVCLVTPNHNVTSEYAWILKNISQDTVPITTLIYSGTWIKETVDAQYPITKLQSLKPYLSEVKQLTEEQKQLLFESSVFCMLPWTSMMVTTKGEVKVCCKSQCAIGDYSKNTLEEIWNSTDMRNLRISMLNGQHMFECRSCYREEALGRDSYRQSANRHMMQYIKRVDSTQENGTVDEFAINYLDVRYSNLCNLACRMCKPEYSTSWHEVSVNLGLRNGKTIALVEADSTQQDLFEQIKPHLNEVKVIYFAGGEPLIIENFYRMLEILDDLGRNDVQLIYNTNLTRTSLKSRSIFDLWNKFSNVSVGASLDAMDARGEYLRVYTKWADVIANRKEMIKKSPHVDFHVNATVTILNALHLPDFHRAWVHEGLIEPSQFNVGLLQNPHYLYVNTAPDWLREEIKAKWIRHIEWLRPRDPLGRACSSFEGVLKYLKSAETFDAEDFWKHIQELDQYHNQDFVSTFPELHRLCTTRPDHLL